MSLRHDSCLLLSAAICRACAPNIGRTWQNIDVMFCRSIRGGCHRSPAYCTSIHSCFSISPHDYEDCTRAQGGVTVTVTLTSLSFLLRNRTDRCLRAGHQWWHLQTVQVVIWGTQQRHAEVRLLYHCQPPSVLVCYDVTCRKGVEFT